MSELNPDDSPHYNVACVYAQAAANGGPNADQYARAAVELLRRADEKREHFGIRPTVAIAHLKFDPDLDPLRAREGFHRFAEKATIRIIETLPGFEKGSEIWVLNVEAIVRDLLLASASEAEPLLRECLAIREKTQSDVWSTFKTKSMLGGALLGQKKYADAEPLLLAGYEGMNQREKTIPPAGQIRIPEALDRRIELSTATNKPDEVKKWQAERAKHPEVGPMSGEKK